MSTQATNVVTFQNDMKEADAVKAYLDMQDDISKLPEEMRNYIFVNVGEYANYLLRLYSKKNWKALLEDLSNDQQEKLKASVAFLLQSIKDFESNNNESSLCGTALRVIQSNLDLANSELPESVAVEQVIAEIIDRWVKVYNQMIYKGIANA